MLTRYRSVALILLACLICIVYLWSSNVRVGLLSEGELRSTEILQSSMDRSFPLTLVDPIGERYTLTHPPKRIVSATLATDEILSALIGVENIIGVTHLVDDSNISNVADFYPDSVKRIRGEVEEILSLEPDLVFVSGYSRAETVRLLLGADVPVVRLTEFNSLADIKGNIKLVAKVIGDKEEGDNLLAVMHDRLERLRSTLSGRNRPRVLYYNLDGSSAGVDSTIDEMIQLAGGYNVMRETGIQGVSYVSDEMLIGLQPDLILVSGWVQQGLSPAQQLAQRSAWKNVPAVSQQKIYTLQGAWLSSVSQYSWEGIEQIAALLHPEVIKMDRVAVKATRVKETRAKEQRAKHKIVNTMKEQ